VVVVEEKKEFMVSVPSWRAWNVQEESALIEDLARVQGLGRVKLALPPHEHETLPAPSDEMLLEKIESSLLGNGFSEVITGGGCADQEAAFLAELDSAAAARHVTLRDTPERACLKMTNVIALAQVIGRNLRAGESPCKVYEYGRLFSREKEPPRELERGVLSLAAAGPWHVSMDGAGESLEELMRLFKGVLESVAERLLCKLSVKESRCPWLQPGRQAALCAGRHECGFFGVLHAHLQGRLDLPSPLLYAELDAAQLLRAAEEGGAFWER
jgi:phenylalanyl-tRNA synthetase beta subunit